MWGSLRALGFTREQTQIGSGYAMLYLVCAVGNRPLLELACGPSAWIAPSEDRQISFSAGATGERKYGWVLVMGGARAGQGLFKPLLSDCSLVTRAGALTSFEGTRPFRALKFLWRRAIGRYGFPV